MGLPMSSAATPAFHAMPQTFLLVPTRYGSTCGHVCARRRRTGATPKTPSIWDTLGSTCRSASRQLRYTAGNTARNTAMAETLREPTHMSRRTMTQTMGTLLSAETPGERSLSTSGWRCPTSARTTASAKASRKPRAMRASEKPTVARKLFSPRRARRRSAVSTGPARRMELPTTRLATCHAKIHGTTGASLLSMSLGRRVTLPAS